MKESYIKSKSSEGRQTSWFKVEREQAQEATIDRKWVCQGHRFLHG